MASFVYDSAREKFLKGELSWTNDDIRVALLKTFTQNGQQVKYIADEGDQSLQDLPISNLVTTSGILYNKTTTAGIAGADRVVFNGIPSGTEITSVVLYKNAITSLQSYLIAHLDTQLITNSTQEVTIQWNVVNGIPWIFRI
jgi:hypothetical protein